MDPPGVSGRGDAYRSCTGPTPQGWCPVPRVRRTGRRHDPKGSRLTPLNETRLPLPRRSVVRCFRESGGISIYTRMMKPGPEETLAGEPGKRTAYGPVRFPAGVACYRRGVLPMRNELRPIVMHMADISPCARPATTSPTASSWNWRTTHGSGRGASCPSTNGETLRKREQSSAELVRTDSGRLRARRVSEESGRDFPEHASGAQRRDQRCGTLLGKSAGPAGCIGFLGRRTPRRHR